MSDEVKLEGWTFAQVPVWALADPALTDASVRLLAYLVWRQGTNPTSWPSVATMAADLRASHDKINRGLKQLKDAAYLTIDPRKGHSSLYTVNAQPAQAQALYARLTTRKSASGDEATTRKSALPSTRKSALQNENHVNENQQDVNEIGTGKPVRTPPPPAVAVFREQTERFPVKSWWKQIVAAVGDEPAALERWGKVCHAYVGQGWSPVNVANMLDFYERGEIPPGNGRYKGKPAKDEPAGFAGVRKWLNEQGVEESEVAHG